MGFHDNEESQLKTRKSRKHNIFPKEVLLLHRDHLKELKGQWSASTAVFGTFVWSTEQARNSKEGKWQKFTSVIWKNNLSFNF